MSIGSFTSTVQGGPGPQSTDDVARGQIARAPVSDADTLYVVTPDLSLALAYEVPSAQWAHASNLPAVGTECVLVFDEQGDAWVPIWAGMIPGGSGDGSGNIDGGEPDSIYGGLPRIDGNGI